MVRGRCDGPPLSLGVVETLEGALLVSIQEPGVAVVDDLDPADHEAALDLDERYWK